MCRRKALEDDRAAPFLRCIDVVAALSRRQPTATGGLMLAVFENVEGINHKLEGEAMSTMDRLRELLYEKLGPVWSFKPLRLNAFDFGLP